MSVTHGRLRPLLRVGLPVAVAAIFVWLAIINIALVKTYQGELEDGVFWRQEGTNVVAADVAAGQAAARAGVKPRDVLLTIDGREVRTVEDVSAAQHEGLAGRAQQYVVQRAASEVPLTITLLRCRRWCSRGCTIRSRSSAFSRLSSARRCGCGGRTTRRRCTSSG